MPPVPRIRRRAALVGAIALATGALAGVAHVLPAEASSADIVISQVYGGGGNTGAPYANDFVELYNRGAGTVSVAGWSVQYAASGGSTAS